MRAAATSAPDYAEHSAALKHTPGPWEYVPSNANHGPYVTNGWGAGDICDCYTMSNPTALAVCNGGDSKPVHFQHDEADANARLIAAAPDLLAALREIAAIGDREELSIHDSQVKRYSRQAVDIAREAVAKAEGRP